MSDRLFDEDVTSIIRGNNGRLIAQAARLWINDKDSVVDVTYGQGNFWTEYRPSQLSTHDIALDGVDCRNLPYEDASFDVVVFDPPYVTGGSKTTTLPDFQQRYGLTGLRSDAGIRRLLFAGMTEAARVLKREGRLFVKCMDYINHDRFQNNRHHVTEFATLLGMEQVDEFVHFSGGGAKFAVKNQVHSRRVHSFLCVFRKGRE